MVKKFIFTIIASSFFLFFFLFYIGIPYQNDNINKYNFEYRGDSVNCQICTINKTGILSEEQLVNNHVSNLKYNDVGDMSLKSKDLNRSIKWNEDNIQITENNKSRYATKNYERLETNEDLKYWINRINSIDSNMYLQFTINEKLTSVEKRLIDIINKTNYYMDEAYVINNSEYAVYKSEEYGKSKLVIKSDGEIRKLTHNNSTTNFVYEFKSQNPDPPIKTINNIE